jgi:hypothetical protein
MIVPSATEFAAHLEHQHQAGVLSALRDLPDELRIKANLMVAAQSVEILKSEGVAAFAADNLRQYTDTEHVRARGPLHLRTARRKD